MLPFMLREVHQHHSRIGNPCGRHCGDIGIVPDIDDNPIQAGNDPDP